MRTPLLVAGLLLIGLVGIAPTAAAFHGCPYNVNGVAIRDGVEYDLTLDWSGNLLLCGNDDHTMSVTIEDADGHVVAQDTFQATEFAHVARVEDCWETVEPYTNTNLAHQFFIEGKQRLNLCNGDREMYYDGFFRDFEIHVNW